MKLFSILTILLTCLPLFSQEVTIFEDSFESGELNPQFWSPSPGPNGVLEANLSFQEVDLAHDGFYGVIFSRQEDGDVETNALDLTLDLTGHTEILLSYWIQGYNQEDNAQNGVFISSDGENFHKIQDFFFESWEPFYGKLPPLNITEAAKALGLELNEQFIIRFQQRGNSDFTGCCISNTDGFMLDMVRVWAPGTTYASLPLFEGFEDGKLNSNWRWRSPDATSNSDGYHDPQSLVGVVQSLGNLESVYDGFYTLALGKRRDGNAIASAADLHLDLSSHDQVDLSFAVVDAMDETNAQDGVWFSDDGGSSFKKVYSFQPEQWRDAQAARLPTLDVDEIATELGLTLSSEFVIRFQQYGDSDFEGCCISNTDGIFIDNISVTAPSIEKATLPFFDGFEGNALKPWWVIAEGTETGLPGVFRTTNSLGIIGNIDEVTSVREGFSSLGIGSIVDDVDHLNAVDLHIDLEGFQNINLSFWLNDSLEENDAQDGIWLSNDGGKTFSKVYQFELEESDDFRFIEINLDEVSSSFGVTYSKDFIIRFQQFGEDDFFGCCSSAKDGIFIDSLSITGDPITYSPFPDRVVPHVTNINGAFGTEIILTNESSLSKSFILYPYTTTGLALESVSGTIPANTSFRRSAAELFNGDEVSHFFISDTSPDVSIVYQAVGFDTPAHLEENQTTSRVWRVFPGEGEGIFDGFAFVNTGPQATSITIQQRQDDGGTIATKEIITGLSMGAKFLYLPGADFSQIQNTHFRIQSDQPLAITALRGTLASTGFVFLWESPATPVEVDAQKNNISLE